MATYTSTTGGTTGSPLPWSAASTWTTTTPSGGPGAGDIVIIANGAVVSVDSAAGPAADGVVIVGSNTSGIGAAVTVSGTSSSSFGTFQVASGCTLQLRGYDATTNTLMTINQYGLFQPQTGSTVLGDVASDYGSVVLNKGRFEPQTGVAFGVPSGNVSWASKVNSEVKNGQRIRHRPEARQPGAGESPDQQRDSDRTRLIGGFPTGQSSGGNQGFYAASAGTRARRRPPRSRSASPRRPPRSPPSRTRPGNTPSITTPGSSTSTRRNGPRSPSRTTTTSSTNPPPTGAAGASSRAPRPARRAIRA